MPTRRAALPLFFAGLAVLILAVAFAALSRRDRPPMVEVETAADLAHLVDHPDYRAALAGEAPVPRVLLAALPQDLDQIAAPDRRKTLFLSVMLPLVLTVNEMVAGDRAQLAALADRLAAGAAPSGEQADWLRTLMRRYRVPPSGNIGDDVAELLARVDVGPPSLALAQAALESGWGTSRLAREGNALFGERTWTEAGLVPLTPLPGARHRAKSFDRLLDAVDSYIRNLNSHPAYAGFRAARAQLRAAGETPGGLALVGYLERYSELGAAYTRAVRNLIRINRLDRFDRSALFPVETT